MTFLRQKSTCQHKLAALKCHRKKYRSMLLLQASVAELVDASDSKSGSSDRVRVRFSPEAPSLYNAIYFNNISYL